jgi:hypothetical protein
MSNFIEVGKIEVARSHLEAGISLFFDRKDPLVVYTVSWTAYQLLSELCQVRGINRQIEDSEILKNLGVHEEVIKAFRKPRNFMQHAGRDPDALVKFFPDSTFLMLLLAIELYQALAKNPFLPGRVMQMWFFVRYPERAPADVSAQIHSLPYKPNADDYQFFQQLLNSTFQTSSTANEVKKNS